MALFRRSFMKMVSTRSFRRFVMCLEACGDRRSDLLRVLTYHRVDDPSATSRLYPELISATPSHFERQMEHLATRYHVVDLNEVIDAFHSSHSLPPRSVLVTFDDAYRDFAKHAWPILQRHELPATLFVPTAFPDQPERAFWWDRLYEAFESREQFNNVNPYGSFRELLCHMKTLPDSEALTLTDDLCQQCDVVQHANPVLGWDELRCLAQQGLTLAPHTRTHPLMNRIPLTDAVDQAVQSREDLQREIGATPAVLAYPGGAYCDELPTRLREAGFELAFTTCRGMNDLRDADPMRLRRINIRHSTPESVVRAQLLSTFRHYNRCCELRSSV
jgi:peptidoglycan/xylan/chitin deacetylase (PgdA/CDA1 family)